MICLMRVGEAFQKVEIIECSPLSPAQEFWFGCFRCHKKCLYTFQCVQALEGESVLNTYISYQISKYIIVCFAIGKHTTMWYLTSYFSIWIPTLDLLYFLVNFPYWKFASGARIFKYHLDPSLWSHLADILIPCE